MPARSELAKVSRRRLLMQSGAAALLLGCALPEISIQFPTPATVPPAETVKPQPTQPEATAVPAVPLALTSELQPTATRVPVKPEPTPTSAVSQRENKFPTAIPRKATPVSYEALSTRGLVWEEKTVDTLLGKYDKIRGPSPSSFSWNKKDLFITNQNNIPAQIDFSATVQTKTTKELWRWRGKGYVLGTDADTVYILNKEAFRVYAFDIKSKSEIWRLNLPENFMETPNVSGKPNTLEVKWPIFISEKLVGIQFARGFLIHYKTSDSEPINTSQGKIVSVFGNRALVTSLQVKNNKNDWASWEFTGPKDRNGVIINNKGNQNGIADDQHLAIAIPDPKDTAGYPDTAIAQLWDTKDLTNRLWSTDKLSPGVVPLHLARDIVVFGPEPNPYNPNTYYILDRNTGNVIDTLKTTRGVNFEFFSKDEWLFASHQQQGTIAFKKEGKIWQNEDLGGVSRCLAKINDYLILTRGGSASGLLGTKLDFEGALWPVDAKTGKRFAWEPVFFDRFTTNSLLVGNLAVIADGISASRFALNTVDLKTGKKDLIFKPGHFITHLEDTGINQIILGQIADQRLFAVKI